MPKNDSPHLALWPTTLMKALPSLLVKLLDQKNGESLERLQLIDVDIKLLPMNLTSTTLWENVALSRSLEGRDHFLTLSGHLSGPEPLAVQVKYFVRGVKKFYKTSIDIEHASKSSPWKSLDQEWVVEHLRALGQENTALSEEALAELNGRQEIQVPSHLIIGTLLQEALLEWPTERARLNHFLLTFLGALNLEEKLSHNSSLSSTGIRGMILSDEQVLISYQFSC